MNRPLLILRSIVIIALGLVFILLAILRDFDVEGVLPKVGLAVLGVLIIAFEAWSWRKRLSSPEDD